MIEFSYSVAHVFPTDTGPPNHPDMRGIVAVRGATPSPWLVSYRPHDEDHTVATYTMIQKLEDPMSTIDIIEPTEDERRNIFGGGGGEPEGGPTAPADAVNDRGPLSFTADAAQQGGEPEPNPLAGFVILAEVPLAMGHFETVIYGPVFKKALEAVAPEDLGTIRVVESDGMLRLLKASHYEPAVPGETDPEMDAYGTPEDLMRYLGAGGDADHEPLSFADLMGALLGGAVGHAGDPEPEPEAREINPEELAAALEKVPDDHALKFVVHGLPLEGYEALAAAWEDDNAEAAVDARNQIAEARAAGQAKWCHVFEGLDKAAFLVGAEALKAWSDNLPPPTLADFSPEERRELAFDTLRGLGLRMLLDAMDVMPSDPAEIVSRMDYNLPPIQMAALLNQFTEAGLFGEEDGAYRLTPRGIALSALADLSNDPDGEENGYTVEAIAGESDLSTRQTQKALDRLVMQNFITDEGGLYTPNF